MADPADIQLTVDGLALSRGERALMEDLSFSLGSGDMLWLTGPNGSGKTSLLMALAGFLSPESGTVRWQYNGQATPPAQILAFAEFIGPERKALSLHEDFSFWHHLNRDPVPVEERLAAVGLSTVKSVRISGLSTGQLRRLSLARLISSRRPVWLLDEPLAGLDMDGQKLVRNTLSHHLAQGGIAIIASHNPIKLPAVTARKLMLEPA